MTLTENLIRLTLENGPTYLEEFQAIIPKKNSSFSLSIEQERALELCLTSSPLMVIMGVVGSGKTRLVHVLLPILLQGNQRTLLISSSLPRLVAPKIDYLPIGSFPDSLLQKLRSPGKLEKWVKILLKSPETILYQLKIEFPEENISRLEILTYRLKELLPLFIEQLSLVQLAAKIDKTNNLLTLATIDKINELESHLDWVIVEDSHTLTTEEIDKLAAITNRLILIGNSPLFNTQNTDFSELFNKLLPNYRYFLSQQYLIHPSLAEPVFRTLYSEKVHTLLTGDRLYLPQLSGHLIWQDIRTSLNGVNPIEGNRIFRFLSEFQNVSRDKIGILTFTASQKEWLESNYPSSLRKVFIGTIEDWKGQQRSLVLISCVGISETMTHKDYVLALTRGLDYLILFGNKKHWSKSKSPLSYLLQQPELLQEREVALL
jgi:hypothetical protein